MLASLLQVVVGGGGRGGAWGLSLGDLLIGIVIIAACVALVYIALRQFNVAIPAWVIQVFWVVVVAFVVILAIRLVLSM